MNRDQTQVRRSDIVRRRRVKAAQTRTASVVKAVRSSSHSPVVGRTVRWPGGGRRSTRRFEMVHVGRLKLNGELASTLVHLSWNWRLASLALCLLMLASLARFLFASELYVDGISLGGAVLIPGEEIYAASGVARQHIAWVDPAEVQKRIEAVSGIAAAAVSVRWPNEVTIIVTERVPVVVWMEGEQKWWVDSAGRKFKARGEIGGLLPISVDDAAGSGRDESVPLDAVRGALQLRDLRPNIELLHYDAQHGLSYQDGRGWRGYFGVGLDMPQKLAVYETLVDSLLARGIYPAAVSVEDIDAPYYRR